MPGSQSRFYPTTIWLVALLMAALLSACSTDGKRWDPEDYTVKSGDTVYSIAWRYEIDPEEFAAWNSLHDSSFIRAGQRLHTRKPANFDRQQKKKREQAIAYAPASTTKKSTSSKWVKAEKGDTLYALSKQYGVSVERLAQLNQLKKPYVIKPGQAIFLKPLNTGVRPTTSVAGKNRKPAGSQKTTKRPQAVASQEQAISWPKTVRWQRPANGKITKKFNRRRNDAKGIDIAGKEGNAIRASAGGKVVYSGNGLISYGNLIIIKHNKTFLSAYAYNRKLLVKEGDLVKAGQQIAEMGHKDKKRAILHFEIRKNGKPVDPLKYLPW